MKLRIQYTLLLVIFAGIFISSCVKKPKYPSEPVISYNNFFRYGDASDPDSVKLVISFTDNEGDIGIDQSDTQGVFKYGNIFLVYFYDSTGNNDWVTRDSTPWNAPMDTLTIFYRVPPVLADGEKDQPMKGLIYVKQQAPFRLDDKIRYDVYMYDKAKHISNRITTPAIIFP